MKTGSNASSFITSLKVGLGASRGSMWHGASMIRRGVRVPMETVFLDFRRPSGRPPTLTSIVTQRNESTGEYTMSTTMSKRVRSVDLGPQTSREWMQSQDAGSG